MRSSAIAWLALLRAFAPTLAFAGANPLPTVADQPKFYFPRVVKRQIFTNTSTITTTTSTIDIPTTERVPIPTTEITTNDLESILNSLINEGSTTTSVAADSGGNSTTTPTETVMTVTIPSIPGEVATITIPIPSVIESPTLPKVLTTDVTDVATPAVSFTPGIVSGFTPGVVVPTSTTDTPAASTDTPILPIDLSLSLPVDLSLSLPTVLPTTDLPTPLVAPAPNDILPASGTGLPAVTNLPIPTTVVPAPDITLPVLGPESQTTTPIIDAPLIVPLVPSITDLPTVLPSVDLPGILSTLLSTLLSDTPTSIPLIVPLVSETIIPTTIDLPTVPSSTEIPLIVPLVTDTGVPATPNTGLPAATDLQPLPTTGLPTIDTGLLPTGTNSLVAPLPTDTSLVPGVTGPGTGSDAPAATTSIPNTPGTLPPTSITPAPSKTGSETVPISIPETTPESTIGGSTDDSKSLPAPQTITPTGTDSATSQWLPPTLVVQTNAPSTLTDPSATQTGIPPGLPKAIAPDGGMPAEPQNTTMIQIGFTYQLPYPFVVAHSITAAQIFSFVPQGISYGLGIPVDQVVMRTIEPYDTTKDLGYVTTLALCFVPSDMVSQLELDLHTPTSNIYRNSQSSVAALMNLINPSFPILAGQGLGSSASGSPGEGNPEASSTAGAGSVFGGQNSNSGPVSTTAVTASLSAVLGGLAYVAVIFIVARRYKQRRQRHQRSSSLSTVLGEREGLGSGPLMGGGLVSGDRDTPGGRATPGNGRESRGSRGSGRSGGNSARTQNISAPMMAENSLGWS
ncbi:MAG: hypothetical protein M1840_002799 [Geoglossum simile]|nr:MAG: hypothetical protein M1840_002799 [Geoglossum simile]